MTVDCSSVISTAAVSGPPSRGCDAITASTACHQSQCNFVAFFLQSCVWWQVASLSLPSLLRFYCLLLLLLLPKSSSSAVHESSTIIVQSPLKPSFAVLLITSQLCCPRSVSRFTSAAWVFASESALGCIRVCARLPLLWKCGRPLHCHLNLCCTTRLIWQASPMTVYCA